MSTLESRYRSALRWYPRSWRAQNADVVVGTLMDEADATGRQHPRTSELFSLAVNGLRARVGSGLASILPDAWFRVSDAAFGIGSVVALVLLVGFEWAHWAARVPGDFASYGIQFGPFVTAAAPLEIAWILACAASCLGLTRTSGVFLVLTICLAVGIEAARAPLGLAFGPNGTTLAFLAVLAAIALAGASGRNRRSLLVAVGGASVFIALVLVSHPEKLSMQDLFPDRLMSLGALSVVTDVRLLSLGFVGVIVLAAIARNAAWLQAGVIALVVCLETALVISGLSAEFGVLGWLLFVVAPTAAAVAGAAVVIHRRRAQA